VARAACASPDHLTRIFRRETGSTLHGYLVRLRLAVALDAVIETEVDLTELAFDLGFASHSHLTYAFRRRYGVPPGAVRRELAARRGDRRRVSHRPPPRRNGVPGGAGDPPAAGL
jgi:AraC-like DNA-binding protein